MGPLEVDSRHVGSMVVLRAVGELDHDTSTKLESELEGALVSGPSRVIFDLSECTFMDSSGSRAIAMAARDLPQGLVGVVCPGAQPRVRLVLEIIGLADLLDLRERVEDFEDPGVGGAAAE